MNSWRNRAWYSPVAARVLRGTHPPTLYLDTSLTANVEVLAHALEG